MIVGDVDADAVGESLEEGDTEGESDFEAVGVKVVDTDLDNV